ncbi:hypothetical protein [Crateriforma conspicua]|uniref:hypothetical protein n=1 Tax=Crateriforma TaxID=2714592 RepID=UPI0011B6EB02|nr:hypothetical protein [Crateriforma conspicua]
MLLFLGSSPNLAGGAEGDYSKEMDLVIRSIENQEDVAFLMQFEIMTGSFASREDAIAGRFEEVTGKGRGTLARQQERVAYQMRVDEVVEKPISSTSGYSATPSGGHIIIFDDAYFIRLSQDMSGAIVGAFDQSRLFMMFDPYQFLATIPKSPSDLVLSSVDNPAARVQWKPLDSGFRYETLWDDGYYSIDFNSNWNGLANAVRVGSSPSRVSEGVVIQTERSLLGYHVPTLVVMFLSSNGFPCNGRLFRCTSIDFGEPEESEFTWTTKQSYQLHADDADDTVFTYIPTNYSVSPVNLEEMYESAKAGLPLEIQVPAQSSYFYYWLMGGLVFVLAVSFWTRRRFALNA